MLETWSRILPTFIGDVIEDKISGENSLARVDLSAWNPFGSSNCGTGTGDLERLACVKFSSLSRKSFLKFFIK